MKLFGKILSRPALRWWITSIWNCGVHWRKTTLWLSALIILGLCLSAQSPTSLPSRVADYRAFLAAQELAASGSYAKAIETLQPVWKLQPISPLLGKAAVLAAQSHEKLGQYADALQILRNYSERLPQPQGLLLLGRNAEAASDTAGAAAYFQSVFYAHPLSKEAIEADAAIARLKGVLGENFPPVMPQVRLERAARLVRSGQAARGRREYAAMAADFGGVEREYAQVRAVADSYDALQSLTPASSDADAERLFLMHAASRKSKLNVPAMAAIEELSRKYPKSRWRLLAIVAQANSHLVQNEANLYEPLYRTCYSDFPQEPEAAFCHWKVTWAAYMRREGTAMFEEHVRLYPQSEKVSAALYFLGRHAELASKYPLSYYATLKKSAATRAKRTQLPDFQPSTSMQTHLDRARSLESLGYPDWAEFELQWAAQNEANSFPAALALAETASRRGAHDVSIRYIKRFAPGYLSIPMDAAPEQFWKLAFPMAYRAPLEETSRERGLDPFVVAALIRQESEFNPKALSRAKAYGLTQVLPSTGRQISRRAGVARFSTPMLFEPEVNLKLGSYYLKTLLDQHGGRWEKTLASYNAGKSRTDLWSTWGEFREPAEFIESVPFTETRNYIQIVLRNAEVYRRLYGATER